MAARDRSLKTRRDLVLRIGHRRELDAGRAFREPLEGDSVSEP
jgi:hypothetical protein